MRQWNTWERYFDPQHPKHKYQVARHAWFMDNISGEKLFDMGCSGGLALFLAGKKGFVKELHGVDIDRVMIEKAGKRLEKYDKVINLHVCEAEKTPYEDGFFDCVMCGETLEHVEDDKVIVEELARVTKKGGTLLVSVPDRGHLSKIHVRLYTKDSLRKLIEDAGFDVIEEDTMPSAPKQRYWYLLLRAIKI